MNPSQIKSETPTLLIPTRASRGKTDSEAKTYPVPFLTGLVGYVVLLGVYGTFHERPRLSAADDRQRMARQAVENQPDRSVSTSQRSSQPQVSRGKTLFGMRIPTDEERAAAQRTRAENAKKAQLARQQRVEAEWKRWEVGQAWTGDVVAREDGTRRSVTVSVASKSGQSGEKRQLILRAAGPRPHDLLLLLGTPTQSAPRSVFGSTSEPAAIQFAKLQPAGDVATSDVFFDANSYSIQLTDSGALEGTAGARYGRGGATFSLAPTQTNVSSIDWTDRWNDTMRPGRVWQGIYEQGKRMGYNERPVSLPTTVTVAAGVDSRERLLIVSIPGAANANRSVLRVTQAEARHESGFFWTGDRQRAAVQGARSSNCYLFDNNSGIRAVNVGLRMLESGELALVANALGSATFRPTGDGPPESGPDHLKRLAESLRVGRTLRGSYAIHERHTSRQGSERVPVTLKVLATEPRWRIELSAKGKSAFTATFEGAAAIDRFSQVQFPLQLKRTDLKTQSKASQPLLFTHRGSGVELLLRVDDDANDRATLVGLTPYPACGELEFDLH